MNKTFKISCLSLLFSAFVNLGFAQNDERQLVNLGANVNTEAVDLNPHITADGKELFFVRENYSGNKNDQDIWVSELGADGKWQLATRLQKPLNTSPSNSIVSVSADGNRVMIKGVYKKGKLHEKGYSIAQRTKEGWTVPEAIKILNYPHLDKGDFNNACISTDEKVIIFSLCPKEGVMDNDLYVSFKKEDGTYSEPILLGDSVNTKDVMEFAPFLASDNKTLYFSSDRAGGFGGTDIYKTVRKDDSWQKWTRPVNLGPKVNGPSRDGYYTLDAKGENAYMVSDKNSIGKADIVMIKLAEEHKPDPVVLLSGHVYDVKTTKKIDAKIVYHTYPKANVKGATDTDHETGKYSVILPFGEKFIIEAHAHAYVAVFDTVSFVKDGTSEYTESTKDFYLTPIVKGEKVVLKHVNFETNSAILDSSSFLELDKVAEFLIENPEVKIMIGGHTDNAGQADKNLTLSGARAKTMKDYIQSKGISADRLESKGFGQTQPIVSNTTPANMRTNRRVEFTITE